MENIYRFQTSLQHKRIGKIKLSKRFSAILINEQVSAVATMLQFSSNKQGTVDLQRKTLDFTGLHSTTVLNFRHKEHSLSYCFGKQKSL